MRTRSVLGLITALTLVGCGTSESPTSATSNGSLISVSVSYMDTVPTALMKVIAQFGQGPVDVILHNNSSTSAMVHVAIAITPGYADSGFQTVTIQPGQTDTVSPTLILNPKADSLTTLTPANFTVQVTQMDGATSKSLFSETHLALLMAHDAFLFSWQGHDLAGFLPIWVTPTNPAVQNFLATAKGYWSGNSWSGYQHSSFDSGTLKSSLTVPSTNLTIGSFTAGYGFVSGTLISSDNITLRFHPTGGTIANTDFSPKQTSVTLSAAPFSGPGDLVLSSGNAILDATVAINLKYIYYNGYVRQQVKAIYNALQARGITYSSTTISFPSGASQKIRYPAASLQEASANCIDGTVLMASALEAIGLQPLIVLVPGHAFLGWRALDGSTTSEFLETTMIGTSTFEDALNQGTTEFNQHQQAGDAKIVDIAKARTLGVTPGARLLQK